MFATRSLPLFVCLAYSLSLSPLFRGQRRLERGRRGGAERDGEKTQEMGNLNEATTYSAAVGPNPYLVLLCGRWAGTLLCSAEQSA